MILTHVAGTVGGATGAAGFGALGVVHADIVSEVIIAVASSIGVFVALLSYWTGRKNDPKQALLDHAGQDTTRFNSLEDKVDMLLEHILPPAPPTT